MNHLWENIFFKQKTVGDDLRTLLRENFLFQDLGERELRFIQSIVHVRHYHAGEQVFRQDEIGVGMYIIAKGRVEIFVADRSAPSDDKRELFITQLQAKDFFGELSLVEDGGRRTATAIAREETTLIGFFKPDLAEVLSRSPGTGTKIVIRLAEVLGRRLKETTDKVSELRTALKEIRSTPTMDTADGQKTSNQTSA